MIATLRRIIASLLIVSIGGLALPLPAQAGIIATDSIAAAGERSRIASLLDRAEVRAQLQAYGVSPADVKARVAALTDDEAAQLAARIDALPAGGADILGVILIVFLVLLITDILGFTKVFPFTRPIK
jgi:uncharacterized protein DUF6627